MKVLLISSRADIGGGPAQMYSLLGESLDNSSGFEFFAALPEGEFHKKFAQFLGAESLLVIPHRKFTLSALRDILRFAKEKKVDLVHSHGKGAGSYGRLVGCLLGIPAIHTLHGFHDAQYGNIKRIIYYYYEFFSALMTKSIICVSDEEKNKFLQKVGRRFEKKISVIKNGTPVSKKQRFEAKKISNKVVTVARLTRQKNVAQVLDIAHRCKKFVFHIIGDGEESTQLKARAADLGLDNVVFEGASDNVNSLIEDATAFLSTSLWEGLPLAPLEAMSLGIPLVLSDIAGHRELIVNQLNGRLFELGNIEDACSQLHQVATLDSKTIANIHGELFSDTRMRSETQTLYRRAIS